MKQTSVNFEDRMHKEIESMADKQGRSFSNMVITILKEALKKEGSKKK